MKIRRRNKSLTAVEFQSLNFHIVLEQRSANKIGDSAMERRLDVVVAATQKGSRSLLATYKICHIKWWLKHFWSLQETGFIAKSVIS